MTVTYNASGAELRFIDGSTDQAISVRVGPIAGNMDPVLDADVLRDAFMAFLAEYSSQVAVGTTNYSVKAAGEDSEWIWPPE